MQLLYEFRFCRCEGLNCRCVTSINCQLAQQLWMLIITMHSQVVGGARHLFEVAKCDAMVHRVFCHMAVGCHLPPTILSRPDSSMWIV